MNKADAIVVFSGGLDSTVLLYDVVSQYGADKVHAISFDYNQKHKNELVGAAKTCTKLGVHHEIVDISFISELTKNVSSLVTDSDINVPTIQEILGDPQPSTYVPYRNMILASICFSYAENVEASKVFSGLQVHDEYSYWDTSQNFIDALNTVSELNRKFNIEYVAPYANMSKCDEILLGQTLDVPFEDTWTCYTGSDIGVACGTCPSCSERIMNFKKAKTKDPIDYAIEIDWGL